MSIIRIINHLLFSINVVLTSQEKDTIITLIKTNDLNVTYALDLFKKDQGYIYPPKSI